jgi:hypothetical protein
VGVSFKLVSGWFVFLCVDFDGSLFSPLLGLSTVIQKAVNSAKFKRLIHRLMNLKALLKTHQMVSLLILILLHR